MLEFAAGLLVLLLALVAVRLLLLRRELRAMTRAIHHIHREKTNRQLRVSSQNREVGELANAINTLYADVHEQRRQSALSIEEMRQNMANISHDLRTPLTSVLGYMQLMQRQDSTPEQRAHYLQVAYGKAVSLGEMVESLFLLAKLDAGAYPMERERLDATALLAEELAGFYEVLQAGETPPVISLSQQPLWIFGDRLALTRVFGNLLQNMAKHGAQDVEITGRLEQGKVLFQFSNSAPALAQGSAEGLFRRFYTGDQARGGENTGLGLAIVKEFVEQMGGAVSARVDNGILCFTLCWDACQEE